MTGQWDREGSGDSSPPPVEKQTLPSISNLTNSMPLAPSPGSSGHSPSQSSVKTDTRDSGNWSMTSTSNHSSFSSPMNLAAVTQGENPGNRPSMLNPDHHRDSQTLNPPFGQSGHGHSPSASSHLSNHSTTSLHSSTRPAPYVLTSPYGIESSPTNSRRSSFDTRLGNLALNSAHGTPAASQVSLALARERSGGYNQGSPAPSILEGGTSHPYTPISPSGHYPTPSVSSAGSGPRSSYGSWSNNGQPPTSHAAERPGATRVAPPIVGSSRFPYPHPNAPSPTKGFPYAFPDPDVAGPTAPNSRDGPNGSHSHLGAAPPTAGRPYGGYPQEHGAGPQHSQTSIYSQASNSTTASSHHVQPPFQPHGSFQELHHHGMQRGNSMTSQNPVTPYSRTPELRVSHKLAERKRRKEMKELFDELRDALPQERGGKSSKWEVLTKSIEYLNQMRGREQEMATKNDNLAKEVERLRSELSRRGGDNNTSHYQAPPSQQHSHYPYPSQNQQDHSRQGGASDSNQMQGVERSSGY